MPAPHLVGANIDTFIGNARVSADFPEEVATRLEELKRQSQDAEEDLPTPWRFAGEVLFIKPHGAGRQWRWILHSPSIHVDVGLGKLTHIVAKARLSSAFLWEHEIGTALTLLYGFLADFLHVPFMLQVSEVHLCVDVAGWELSLDDMPAFITRSRSKGLRLGSNAADEKLDASLEATGPFIEPSEVRVQFAGRRLATLDFSKGAPHACCIYDNTAEISVSRKDWMHEVWTTNGWDGKARVTRVEFRHKRECLREMKVEEAYAFLDQIPSLWAYSTKQWLRHTVPNGDPNRARWPLSSLWQLVQQASFFCDGTPAVRDRRRVGDLTLLCQMIAGCSTSAAAFLTQCSLLAMMERISSSGSGTGSNATSPRKESASSRSVKQRQRGLVSRVPPNPTRIGGRCRSSALRYPRKCQHRTGGRSWKRNPSWCPSSKQRKCSVLGAPPPGS